MAQPILPETKNWRFELDVEGIGWLTIDTPGASVNTLSRAAIAELEALVMRFEDIIASGELIGVVLLSGKASGFIAGADISEFDEMSDFSVLPDALRRTHALFDRIEKLRAPFVCGIHGFCLGGGLELALACHWRIAVNDDKTRIGFPEVNLGIFPGFGGTGRSIRQAGPVDAMQAMLTGKMIRAGAARGMGLVDKLVRHRDQLRWEGRKAVLGKRRSKEAGFLKRVMAMGPLRDYVADKMRKEVQKKARKEHYPAPYELIHLFERHGNNPPGMIKGEIDAFVPLLASETATNLRRVFFLSEGLKKQGLRGNEKPVFNRVHVVGAGVMGGDIAAWCAFRGMSVTLQDLDMERIKPALARAKSLFKKRYRKKQEVDAAVARLEADPTGKGIARADVIIEAVVENLDIKRKIFSAAEKQLKPGAILATNTSSIELERIAEGLADPSRLIGLHFFNPVAQLPLVEVIRSTYNSDQEIAKGASFALAIGKSPVIVKSAPGFLVNRVLMPYMLGAVERVERGESPELIDAAAVAFGMPMGPIELMDTVGLDVGASVAKELGHAVPAESRFAKLVAEGKLGRKSGSGFYTWDKGKAQKGVAPEHPDLAGLGRELVKPLVDTTEVVVGEGVVASPELADIGVILGTGFAPFLGGPLKARQDGRLRSIMPELRKVAIVGSARIPFCRGYTGYTNETNLSMLSTAFGGLADKYNLKGERIGEVMAGAVIAHSRDFNLAREALLDAGFSPNTPGTNVQIACGTSLQAALSLGAKIATGEIESAIAGGSDTVSDSPIVFGDKFQHRLIELNRARTGGERLRTFKGFSFGELAPVAPSTQEPRTGLSMGEHCELMAKQWGISREAQDAFALKSHQNASKAYDEGFHDDLVVACAGIVRDNNVRADTSLEKMASMKPAFDRKSGKGTLTAANSTPLTDGASSVLLASEDWAKARGLPVLAYLTIGQVAANDFAGGDGLLMAPTIAVSDMLRRANLGFADIDLFEIHEAFAAQVLCTLKAWEDPEYNRTVLNRETPLGPIDPEKINVKGSSLAYGHPFAATGARILGLTAKLLNEQQGARALLSVCTAGGMGVAAIVERAAA